MIPVSFSDLSDLLSRYAAIGYMEAVRAYEPTQDMVRLKDIKNWLKMMLVDYKVFKALVDNGTIKAHRGTAANSPLYYSKKEIAEALANARVSSLITKYRMESRNKTI